MTPLCEQIPERLNESKIHGNLFKDIHNDESATALLIFSVCHVKTLLDNDFIACELEQGCSREQQLS